MKPAQSPQRPPPCNIGLQYRLTVQVKINNMTLLYVNSFASIILLNLHYSRI